jgi:acyl-CoA reductase-like NAD-dependent aldehyde dehydrogenase
MPVDQLVDTLYIGGEARPSVGGRARRLVAPATEEIYAETTDPSVADADRAVEAARRALADSRWSACPVEERAAVVLAAVEAVQSRVDEIAVTSAYEMGAPVQVTRMMTGVVGRVIQGMADIAVRTPDVEPGSGLWDFEIQRAPVGVVLDLVPWNSPFTATMMKSAHALLAGCSVISKPPPTAPLAVRQWARALDEAGLPKGVYSVLPADVEVSEHLVTHPAVDLVVFTGGTTVGRRVAELCGANLKRVVLELGGKSAAVVLDDADLQQAVDAVASGVYFNSGQICSALSRLIVPRRDVDEVVERLRTKAEGVVIGDPLDGSTTMGPMATQGHYERVLTWLVRGQAEGARLEFGGTIPAGIERGWYLSPALFVATNQQSIAREEIFGPVATVIGHDGEDDAVRIANDSAYGLGGSVFGADPEHARRVASRLDTGSVTVNGYTTNLLAPRDPHKSSGIGSITGAAGYQTFRSSRLVNLQAAQGAWTPGALFASSTTVDD